MASKRTRTDYESDRPSSQTQPPFVFYGTPLPPLDSEARDDGSYVPLWKQEVRDERGRKRLHGAFTGGFSAGYFNTVGSKEGWSPSTFVSSRTNKNKQDVKRAAENVMDDEDLADLEESQKLQTQSAFAGLGSTQNDRLRRGLISDLFHDSNDTMGVKLLQRMGWKLGQGVGPRVKRSVRTEGGAVQEDTEARSFAPDDVPMISFNRKTDKFGLGWEGEERLSKTPDTRERGKDLLSTRETDDEETFLSRKPLSKKSKPKESGMGVSVLNDTGSDDDDPYELGPKISYNRVIGADKKKKRGGLISSTTPARTTTKSVFLSQRLTSQAKTDDFHRCHDGRLPLDGFILATQALTLDDGHNYAPPTVPTGWRASGLADIGTNTNKTFESTADAAKASTMDPSRRAAILGEAALPGKSIFDYVSPTVRNKLASETGANLPQGKGEAAPAGFEQTAAEKQRSMWDLVPRLDRAVAQSALERGSSGWMPYAEDDSKRARYRSFLESMTGQRQELPVRASNASTDEWITEMREFAQAAMVFKPVSGLMASRFTSAKSGDGPKKASDAIGGTNTEGGIKTGNNLEEKAEDPAEQAAKLGMYGHLTRSKADFYPTRLTCKRFGVKPPAHVLHGPDAGEAQKERFDVVGKAKIDEMMREASGVIHSSMSVEQEESSTEPHLAPAKVDIERNEAIEGQRAGEELFKAIFGSDEEDD